MDTILVLDDDRVFCDLIQIVLQLEGYKAVVVSAPEELIPAARKADPALILMDIHVADTDTFGVLRDLKADGSLGAVPVVMTSGLDYAERSMSGGAAAFLVKPFRPVELLSMIAGLLGRQELDYVEKKKE